MAALGVTNYCFGSGEGRPAGLTYLVRKFLRRVLGRQNFTPLRLMSSLVMLAPHSDREQVAFGCREVCYR